MNTAGLSPRQLEVMKLLALGYTRKKVARELCIAAETVKVHKANLMERMGFSDMSELVQFAWRNGVVA